MNKPKRFIECLLPVTICNLKCEYCYIIQEGRRTNEKAHLSHSPEYIAQALSKKRLGGISYISICGAGETLIDPTATVIVYELLKEGHYVNITTNGTIVKEINNILSYPQDFFNRLHISFSLHFLELKKKNLINTFFENVKRVKNAGVSILVQCNLNDGYLPYLEEIKQLCMKQIGAYPQLCATRNEVDGMRLFTQLDAQDYYEKGKNFKSPLFDFTMKNFNIKRHEFCYAGDWSGVLNLETGEFRKCYGCTDSQNIYENIEEPIKFEAIGRNCCLDYCVNSSHFLSLGIIPELNTPTYAALRNRDDARWYSSQMLEFLNHKLGESNLQYSLFRKLKIDLKAKMDRGVKFIGRYLPDNIRKELKKFIIFIKR